MPSGPNANSTMCFILGIVLVSLNVLGSIISDDWPTTNQWATDILISALLVYGIYEGKSGIIKVWKSLAIIQCILDTASGILLICNLVDEAPALTSHNMAVKVVTEIILMGKIIANLWAIIISKKARLEINGGEFDSANVNTATDMCFILGIVSAYLNILGSINFQENVFSHVWNISPIGAIVSCLLIYGAQHKKITAIQVCKGCRIGVYLLQANYSTQLFCYAVA